MTGMVRCQRQRWRAGSLPSKSSPGREAVRAKTGKGLIRLGQVGHPPTHTQEDGPFTSMQINTLSSNSDKWSEGSNQDDVRPSERSWGLGGGFC